MMNTSRRRVRRMTAALFGCLFLLVGAMACEQQPDNPTNSLMDKLGKEPLVSVNGTVYTKLDFYRYSAFVLEELDSEHFTNDQIRDQLIEDFVTHILLYEKARELGLSVEEQRLESIRKSITEQLNSERLGELMETPSLDPDVLTEQIRQRMITDKLLNEVVGANITVTEQELRDYYRTVSKDQSRERRAHVLHIVTNDETRADEALAELHRGTPFAEVAESFSTGPRRMYGGDLGVIRESDYPEFFGAVFSLREGQFTNVIKSDYGYHIFKLVEFVSAPKRTYDEMKNSLYVELYAEKQEDRAKEYIDELHQNAKVEILSAFSLDELPHADDEPVDGESGDNQ